MESTARKKSVRRKLVVKIISGDIIYSANRTRKFDFINNGIIKISSKRFFAAVRFPPLTPPCESLSILWFSERKGISVLTLYNNSLSYDPK